MTRAGELARRAAAVANMEGARTAPPWGGVPDQSASADAPATPEPPQTPVGAGREDEANERAGGVTPENFPGINDFLYYLSAECMQAHNTIISYERDLRRLAAFLLRNGISSPEAVQAEEVVDFIASLCEEGLEPTSRARMLVAVRMYYRFLIGERLVQHDPCLAVDQPKLGHYLPHELSEQEVESLLRAEDGHDPLSVRNRAILEVFYATGARVSEVCSLRVHDVDLDQQKLRVLGKGSKVRICPLGQAAREAVSYYADLRGLYDKGRGCPAFFLSKSGKGLERVAVFRVVKTAALKAGITRNVYPHLLRHSFATHMLRGGANLRIVQELLGHSDLMTTEIYTHVANNMKNQEYFKYHPHAKPQDGSQAAQRGQDDGF